MFLESSSVVDKSRSFLNELDSFDIIKSMSLSGMLIKQIIHLRERGHSIPEITAACKISKSTAARYVKNISILPQYQGRWRARRNASKIISERHWQEARARARKAVRSITEKDLILTGAALYWAEGSKKDFSLSNTDPVLIRIFLFILRNAFKVKDKDLKISLRIYEDLDQPECLKFWSAITGIKLGRSTSINILQGRKRGKLKYGMCRIRVRRGGLLLKEIFSIINQVDSLTASVVQRIERETPKL